MKRILIIEDNLELREMLCQFLKREGYEVAEASDGKVGCKLYEEQEFDLIITDLIMPEKEGIETIRELIYGNPEVKIIAISGGGRVEPETYLRIAKKLGALRTFTKPFDLKDLLVSIKELLGDKP